MRVGRSSVSSACPQSSRPVLIIVRSIFFCAFRLFGAYTLDVIAATGFGLDTHFLVESDNPLLKHVFSMTSKSKRTSVAEVLASK